jgi:hypothetical protein
MAQFHKDNNFIRIVMGPVGCLAGDTKVVTEYGSMPIEQIDRPMRVLSWNADRGQYQFSPTGGAFPKGRDYLYQVTTTQGKFVASGHHLLLCADHTYQRVDTLCQGQSVFLHFSLQEQKTLDISLQELLSNAPRYSRKLLNLMGGYAKLARQYGQRLLEVQDTFPEFVPSQDDVQRLFSAPDWNDDAHKDDLIDMLLSHSRPNQSAFPISIDDFSALIERPDSGEGHHASKELCEHNEGLNKPALQSRLMLKHHLQDLKSSSYSHSYPTPLSEGAILKIERLPVKQIYWDIQVLDVNNYITEDGAIHHNSGKSVGCCWEIYMRAMNMPANKKGVRHSRWVVVRNTLPQLETTTMATWKDWFGPHVFKGAEITGRSPYRQLIEHPMTDGTTLKLEMIFMALDGPLDIGKLMSLECTGIWFNELRYIDETVFREAQTRPGRFPQKKSVDQPFWSGIIADTNPPDVGGWIYKLCEELKPSNVSMYKQPSGTSAQAENKKNLPDGYYENMSIGKPKEWVNVYVHGKYGYFHDGASVYEGVWNDDTHYTDKNISIIPGKLLIGGLDASGRSPAAVIAQQTATGQYQIIWELCASDIGAVGFSRFLKQQISADFPTHNIRWWGDPAGGHKSQTDERTYFDILKGEGIEVYPSPGFRFQERLEGVNSILSRMVHGQPAMIVGNKCKRLRQGFNGGYRYRKIGHGDAARTLPEPEKNEYSHVHDALQYLVAGTGELNIMKKRNNQNYKVVEYDTDW